MQETTEYGTSLLGSRKRKPATPKWLSTPVDKRHERVSNRILDRTAPYNQSNGVFRIFRANRNRTLYTSDWYHTVINQSMFSLVIVFILIYVFVVTVFAFGYWAVSDSCSLEIYTFRAGFYFSLETIMTIGYGLPGAMGDQPYFNECDSGLLLILVQSIISILLDALCVGIVFGRMARGQTRATTIIFSDFAVIRRIRGKLHLMFQVVEMRKHQLVEAHIRCYCITRHKDGERNIYFRSDAMRLSKPDDELGSTLLMCLPSIVVHDIDNWSPLNYLIKEWKREHEQTKSHISEENQNANNIFVNTEGNILKVDQPRQVQLQLHSYFVCILVGSYIDIDIEFYDQDNEDIEYYNPSKFYEFPNVLQRDIDVVNGNREIRHFQYNQPSKMYQSNSSSHVANEEKSEENSHYKDREEENPKRAYEEEEDVLRRALNESKAEIVVLVEGVDATTSYSIQARHSYTFSDMLFHHDFVPCVSEDSSGGACLDFSKFHDVVPLQGKDIYSSPKYLFSSS